MGYITDLRKEVGSRPLIMTGACVMVVNQNHELLLQVRKDNQCWGLPGGSMEMGETLDEPIGLLQALDLPLTHLRIRHCAEEGVLVPVKREKRIYLVRHCEAEGQSSQSPLTSNGMKQADQLCDFFANRSIEMIISSPFSRAIQTIEPLSKKLNIEIEIDDRLSERILSSKNLPDWLDKLEATYEDLDLSFEGGESSREATQRIVQAVEDVLKNRAGNTIIVSHGNILSLLMKHFDHSFGFEQWRNMSNPDVYLFTVSKEKYHVERVWN